MLDQGHIIAWPAFDLSAMEKLLAISKPCHVICFCKFAENIPNPIIWPMRGKRNLYQIYKAFVRKERGSRGTTECKVIWKHGNGDTPAERL